MLQSKLQIRARVLRDGKWSDLPARELVPGDIVRLRMGDFVPLISKLFRVILVLINHLSLERAKKKR